MTANARALTLDRIRKALRDVPDAETPGQVPVPRNYRRSHATGDIVALFAERAAGYRAGVTRTDEQALPAVIAQLLRQRHVQTLIAAPGFPAGHLAQAGTSCQVAGDAPPLPVARTCKL